MVEYIVAIDVTRVRFPADAFLICGHFAAPNVLDAAPTVLYAAPKVLYATPKVLYAAPEMLYATP